MNIQDDKPKMIFRNDVNGKALYSIGLSHKKQDGSYENGYMTCRFTKDTDLKNKTKIKILSAWIDFYIKDKVTHTYLFINKFEKIEDEQNIPQNVKTEYDNIDSDIQLQDDDLPF